MKSTHAWVAAAVTITLTAVGRTWGDASVPEVDPSIPPYSQVSGVSGSLSSVGSDTLNNLMTFWAEKFGKFYPNVKVQVEGKGSSTAPPALISGTAQLGPMSRAMKNTEVDEFERKYGYQPTQVKAAVDALAVFVNKDNPIKCLSLEEVDAMFSKSRRRGHPEVETWGDLGLAGDWKDRPISLYGRNSASGTYGFFKEHTLQNGDYKDSVKEQPGSASVVQGVTVDRYGAGYSGVGYVTPGVRAVQLATKKGGECEEASAANAYSGKYPLARFLYIYVNKPSSEAIDPLVGEFLKLVLSKEGQEAVVKDGYYPLPASIDQEERKKLG
ncbi:MAG: phosphate transport system substrate-binding protein [Candidatus Binatota bacterium]|jgi:phosphate transport system substrate-binding protein|nr:phosphate transport system substrate-binding protein [Candidatus Binatota bacterium]